MLSLDGMTELGGHVVIFAPAPIYPVTIENESGRTPKVHFHLGGQSAWVGRTVRTLGGTAVLCGPIGGEGGAVLRALAEDERTGVPLRPVVCSRPDGGHVHDRRLGRREVVVEVPAPALSRHEADDLYSVTIEECARAGVLVMTGRRHEGVILIGVYTRLPADAAALGCRVVADLDGPTVRALNGPVDLLKVAYDDLDPLEVQEFEPRGAGDSMTGALAHCMAAAIPLERALRLATAAGATSVTRHGHACGQPATVEQLADRVQIRRIYEG